MIKWWKRLFAKEEPINIKSSGGDKWTARSRALRIILESLPFSLVSETKDRAKIANDILSRLGYDDHLT